MGPRAWTGSWTESPVQTVQSGASMARLRGIRAASARSARSARGRTSHNPPVVGSSPTRPTYFTLQKYSKNVRWLVPGTPPPTVWFLRMSQGPSQACLSFTARRRGSLPISLGDLSRTRGDIVEG
jgi:hypothetical protein